MKNPIKICGLVILILILAVIIRMVPVSQPLELSASAVRLIPDVASRIQTGFVLPWQQIVSGDKVVMGGVFELKAGEVLNGNLLVIGGNATLDQGSIVDGDVAILGGNLSANGMIDGSLFGLGGSITLSNTAQVSGDVNVVGGSLQGANRENVAGKINTDENLTIPLQIGNLDNLRVPNVQVHVNPFWNILWFLFQIFIWAALAVLACLFLARPIERVAQTASSQPLISGGLGLLTAILAPLILVLISITIIGIPLVILLTLGLVVAGAYGFIAIGTEVGKRLEKMSKSEWSPAVSAGLGTLLLALITFGIGKIPCIGWIVPFLVGAIGLGAVVLTRFGTQSYPTQTADSTSPVEPITPAQSVAAQPSDNAPGNSPIND